MDPKSYRYPTQATGLGVVCLLILSLAMPPVFAREAAARVQFVVGDVSAISTDGDSRSLSKGDRIYSGDTIKTSDSGVAQLIYRDRSRMAVRVNTEFTIKEFKYSQGEESGSRSIFSLLSGALRTVTGLIGSARPESVIINTPIATIGIRGTDHEVVHISPEFNKRKPIADVGTYNKVYVGTTVMKSDRGTLNLGVRQSGFIGGSRNKVLKPVRIKDLPKAITEQLINRIPLQAKVKPKAQPTTTNTKARSTDKTKSSTRSSRSSIGSVSTSEALDSTKSFATTIDSGLESNTLVEPSLKTTISTTDTLKSTTTISPTDTLESTTTISPTKTLEPTITIAPTYTLESTTTISPIDTLKSTTTISPTYTLEPTTTISPTRTLESTTTIAPTTISK